MPGNKKKRRSQIEAPMQLNYLRVGEYFTVTDGGRDLYKKLDDVKELVIKYGVSVEIINYSQLETLPMAMSVYRVTEHRLIKTKDDDEDFQDWDDGNPEGIPEGDCEQDDLTPIEKIRQFHQTVKNIPSTPLCVVKYKAATEDLTNALIDELERQDTILKSQKIHIDKIKRKLKPPVRYKRKGKKNG